MYLHEQFLDEVKSSSGTAKEQCTFDDGFIKIYSPKRADEFAKAEAKIFDEFKASASTVNLTKPFNDGIQIILACCEKSL